jgi:hypothetical protein
VVHQLVHRVRAGLGDRTQQHVVNLRLGEVRALRVIVWAGAMSLQTGTQVDLHTVLILAGDARRTR